MKQLPDINLESNSVYEIINGRIRARVLLTGIELGVFDHLATPISGPEVAERLNTHPANTALLLDGLTALGLLEKSGGLYRNTKEAEISLTRQSPAYVGKMLAMMNQMTAPSIEGMTGLVKNGPPPAGMDMGAEEIWVEFARTMANYQRSGTARELARMVAGIDGFSSFQKMMDLGGGSGIFAIALLAEHPTMTGVVFDQPAVVKVAESFIAQYEVQDRLSVMGGDYTSDPLGEGYDLIWASATLNFTRNDLPRMMARIYETLNPGGVFISLADGVTHERTQPTLYALESLSHALNGLDMMFDKGEIAEAMRGAGFAEVESRTVPTPMMAMEMDIARKGG